jgi:hypothetical protein
VDYGFDRFLRYDEMCAWLHATAAAHPEVMAVEAYGRSFEGRELLLVTITDRATGGHDTKPAHWVDANIHAVEVTAGVAALYLVHHLVEGFGTDAAITEAVRTRTFYIVPRVNPDGVEAALADSPAFRRSSMRPWPWRDGHRAPGLHERDIDGDGRVLSMRVPDPNGGWMASADEPRLMVRVPADGITDGRPRYRMLFEGEVVEHDGFTVPLPHPPERLDLNRNFPAGWSNTVLGAGDHPLSEPEVDALVRAVVARPNVCGYNAFHTSGGVLLRPSSTQPDSALPPVDVYVWGQLAEQGTALTGYPVHSVYEDFTFDKSDPMSGAGDDWAYYELGVYAWTTEFWDVIRHATGTAGSTQIWYTGPTDAEELAVYRWAAEHVPAAYADWVPFVHPQLGPVEIGGWDEVFLWANAPAHLLLAEVQGHARFAVHQALCTPKLEVLSARAVALGGDTHRVEVGIANTGWLPTEVTQRAHDRRLVLPIVAELTGAAVAQAGTARQELGQLAGRVAQRLSPHKNDGTPDRVLATWMVQAPAGTTVHVTVTHPRAGRVAAQLTL